MGFESGEILRKAGFVFYRALWQNRTCPEDRPPSLHNLTNRKTQLHQLLSPMAEKLWDLADWMGPDFEVF
jgi:hypothetical protein